MVWGFFMGYKELSSLLKNRSPNFDLRLLGFGWLVCSKKINVYFVWYYQL
jgi:hypothetical protein